MRAGDAARDQDADAALTPRQRQLVRPASGRRKPHPSAQQGGTPSPRSRSRTSQAFLSALRREGTENAASRAARTVHVRGIPPKHGSRAALRAIVEKVGAVVSVEVMGQSFLRDQDGAPLAGGIEEIVDGASSYSALVTFKLGSDALAFCCYDTRVQRGCYTARKTWECKMVAPEQMRSLAAQFTKARRDAEAAADSRLRSLGQTAAASIEVTLDAIGDGSSAVNQVSGRPLHPLRRMAFVRVWLCVSGLLLPGQTCADPPSASQGNVAVTTGPGSPPAATPAIIGAATDRTPTVWSPREPTMRIAGKHAGMTIKGRRFFTVFPAPSSSSPRTEEGEPRSLPRLPATDSGGTADRLQGKLGEHEKRTPNGFAQMLATELRLRGCWRSRSDARGVACAGGGRARDPQPRHAGPDGAGAQTLLRQAVSKPPVKHPI